MELVLFLVACAVVIVVCIRWNDSRIGQLPASLPVLPAGPPTIEIEVEDEIPAKTGRRYIVVGGAGFLGGWIVSRLIQRGEDPSMIRVLDISPLSRRDLPQNIPFFKSDLTDPVAVHAAFAAPWPDNNPPLTVFHTAASIRFYERHPDLLSVSAQVNVHGTQNVIDAARAVGASIVIYTSSGSTCVRRSRFWLWPWEREPPFFVQVINDVDDTIFPKQHDQFFSNYAATKAEAEKIVRAADKTDTANGGVLRTGCLRPGNGIFGPGDMLCHAYIRRATNPTWVSNTLQSFIYVENCVAAHLCYEQRLIELGQPACTHPDIGGDAFAVADPGPPVTFGNIYTILEKLTAGKTQFTHLSPTAMLLLSHLVELYYCTRQVLGSKRFPILKRIMPPITGDLVQLQPSLFALTQVHLIFDDSRARLPPEKGGLGYRGAWTTIQGVHRTYHFHTKGFHNSHNSSTGGVTLGLNLFKKHRALPN